MVRFSGASIWMVTVFPNLRRPGFPFQIKLYLDLLCPFEFFSIFTSFGVDLSKSVVAQFVHQTVEHSWATLSINSASKEKYILYDQDISIILSNDPNP